MAQATCLRYAGASRPRASGRRNLGVGFHERERLPHLSGTAVIRHALPPLRAQVLLRLFERESDVFTLLDARPT